MTILQAIILGLIQGLTEFIPISSSGHLVLAHSAMGLEESGLVFDVALHVGTFGALMSIFHKEVIDILKALFKKTKNTRLAWMLVLATIPAVIVGYFLESYAETTFRSSLLVAWALIAMALVMLVAEWYSKRSSELINLEKTHKKQSIMVGLAQSLAIIPGVSRSGITITAGLFAGFDRVAATKFSFLLALPVTLGAIIKVMMSPDNLHQITHEKAIFAVGIITAFISGVFAIKFMLKYLSNHSLNIFAYYRLVVGALVLILIALN